MRNREREEDEGLRKGRKGSKAIYWFEKCRQKTDHNCSVYGSEERGYCRFKELVKTSKNQGKQSGESKQTRWMEIRYSDHAGYGNVRERREPAMERGLPSSSFFFSLFARGVVCCSKQVQRREREGEGGREGFENGVEESREPP